MVGEDGWGEQSMNAPGQFCASSRLLGISIDRCRGDVLFESIEPGFETFDTLLDVFEFLRPFKLVASDSPPPDQYFIMLDEFAHPAEGGLEGREPIGRLFCNVKENLCASQYSLFLDLGVPTSQEAGPAEGVESTHTDFDLGRSQRFRVSPDHAFETCLCFQSTMDVAAR